MAFYNLQETKKKIKPKEKNIGIAMLVITSFVFLFLFTGFVPFMKTFLLGVFGLFAYPLSLTIFFVAIALVNNKKYVMSKKYIMYLSLCIVFVLAIFQLIILGKPDVGYFAYLGLSYTKGITAGGILISLLTAPIIYALDLLAGYIFFLLALVVSIAITVDYIYYLNKSDSVTSSIRTISNLQKTQDVETSKNININMLTKHQIEEKKKTINLITDKKVEESYKENQAKIKLGLLAGNLKQETPKAEKPKNPYDYIMTTPQVDMSHYNKMRQRNEKQAKQAFEEMQKQQAVQQQTQEPSKAINDEMPEFNTKKAENSKKAFVAPLDEILNEDESVNDRADEILKEILDDSKPIEIEPEPITPTMSRRRNFSQMQIDGTEKKKENKKKHKTYSKPPTYNKPPIDLLNTIDVDLSTLNEDVEEKKIQLESALDMFKIPAKVIGVVVGPTVTRYELEMPPGISVKKILAHSDDIALALASKGDIRIEAPIPGKSAVGIEVPNEKIATVSLKEILSAPNFTKTKAPLTFALGKDISGKVRVCNLQKMPHLLVAGATGSGKSVCLNSIIISMIYKTSPEDLKLILVDPKRVEFSSYNKIPHLLIPNVITETEKAINAFNWAIDEMERRFELLAKARVRNIDEYNDSEKVRTKQVEKMPFIVIIVDELADLMSVSKKEAEEKIKRLAQKARACGIHLILATQRPSVDVITGTIKANFPSRIAFMVTSPQDSRTILDQGGAEKLLGKGDMLYAPSDAAEPGRIQGCFVSTPEVEEIVDFVKNNNEYDFDTKVEEDITNPKTQEFSLKEQKVKDRNAFDPLMEDALRVVVENGQASISMLQRRLVIGFPRAARIIDYMQRENFISPSSGSKPRTVFITEEEIDALFNKEEE